MANAIMQNLLSYGPFTPKNVAGLFLWVRGDLGVTSSSSRVSVWADQSGNGNNFLQATTGNQPTFSASGGPNSTPWITCNSSNPDSMRIASFALNQTFHAFWVGQRTTSPTDGCGLASSSSARNDLWDIGVPGWGTYAGNNQQYLTAAVNTNFMFEYLCAGASSNKRLSGTDNAASPGTNACSDLNMGNNGALGAGGVNIAEIAIYNAQITGASLTNLRSYFNIRYGLTT